MNHNTDNMDVARLCAAHKGPRSAAAVEPGWLCPGCDKGVLDALRDCARLWDQMIELATGAGGGSPSGAPGSSLRAPTRLDILAVMDPRSRPDGNLAPAAAYFADWAWFIAAERRFARPQGTYNQIRFIETNWRWVKEQNWVGDLAREVRDSRATLAGLCGETKRVIARCQAPHPDPQVDEDCNGPLFQDADGAAGVTCAKCGDRFSDGAVFQGFGELRRLGLILESGVEAS